MSNEPSGRSERGAIIVFDGVCVLCNGWVRFLVRHDVARRYRFAAMQSDSGRGLLAAHGLDPCDPDSFLLIEHGRAWTGSDAVLRVLGGLGGRWRVVVAGRLVPRPVRDALYRLVARKRYRWFGRHAACPMPSPELAGRFLP